VSARLVVLDEADAELVRRLCEAFVPGSSRVAPEVYVDALLAAKPDAERRSLLADFASLDGADLAAQTQSEAFATVRAIACEAFYSDFVAPGAPGPGAYEEIDFSFPLADRVRKDWSFMGVRG
jgi:hypothetical protein